MRPRDAAGKTRRRVAAELIADLERVYQRKKAANKELTDLVAATGTGLLNLNGIGPSGAARLLVEIGDITGSDQAHFASWNGTAPIDASSGDQVRHRLSRAGNRQINRVLHIMARVQIRNPSQGHDYYERKKTDGKTPLGRGPPARPRRKGRIVGVAAAVLRVAVDEVTAGVGEVGAVGLVHDACSTYGLDLSAVVTCARDHAATDR